MNGKIKLQKRGLLTVYSCTCGGYCEADEAGYFCTSCGAKRGSWFA